MSRRRTRNLSVYMIVLIILGTYFHIQHATRSDSNDIRTGHLALAQSMFHPLDIEQLLLPTANEGIVTAKENDYFTSLLIALRRLYHFNLPKCRPNVHFALLMIYLTKQFPPYLHHFLSTAARNPSIDVIILASADDCIALQAQYHGTNIYITCVHREVFYFFITDGLCSAWKCKISEFHQIFEQMKRKLVNDPDRLVDMKPMLGSLFRRYLSCYNHWAFGDSAVWFGNFDKLYPVEFAREYDIITFSYGDDNRIYMRGQLTVLKKLRSILSLWTKMKRFASYKAFFEMIRQDTWNDKTITEGSFSSAIVDYANVTWIQLPGFQVQYENLRRSRAEVTVSIDHPPSLIFRRNYESSGENIYTKLNKSHFSNMKEVKLLKGTDCETKMRLPVDEQRCIRITESLPSGYATVVTHSKDPTKVLTRNIAIGMKEYLLFNFRAGKDTFAWSEIRLDQAFQVNITHTLFRTS